MATVEQVRATALAAFTPPPRLRLSDWLEEHIVLPLGTSALPGPLCLFPPQREIADAIGDPTIERVTLVKPVRVGFTTLLTGALAAFVANDPSPVLCLLPTEADARDYVVSDVEPIFAATPAVAGMLEDDTASSRNTLLSRRFPGGSLKVVAAKAPRNLRRHTARVLMIDEADAMEVGAEGSPIVLAERRTLSFPDRKIVLGSTPLDEATSHVLRAYAQSDARVFEVPCPSCSARTEMRWSQIEWQSGRPETAKWRCPGCEELVGEEHKARMVASGRWRATRPEVAGHAGFRLSALVSPLANASWPRLAAEFLKAREDTEELRVFVNTMLGEGWREAAVEVDEAAVAERAEAFGLEAIPADVLLLTAGVDVQDDRLEVSLVGWSRTEAFVLAHVVVWGSPSDDATWGELDKLLGSRWTHPEGGTLRVDATIVDSGDRTDAVYAFCFPRLRRRVWAGKGVAGARAVCEMSKSRAKGGRLFLVGVDTVKASLMDKLARGRSLRFSRSLEPSYFEQLASERKVVRFARGQPVRRFERKPGARAEALDCLVYAIAARHMLGNAVSLDARAAELANPSRAPAAAGRVESPFVAAW